MLWVYKSDTRFTKILFLMKIVGNTEKFVRSYVFDREIPS